MGSETTHKVLFIHPPVYDFALYDLFLKPYGLFRLMEWFSSESYEVEYLDCLDWSDPKTVQVIGPVKRKSSGTGKFPMTVIPFPFSDIEVQRRYHRYGILAEVIKERILSSAPDLVCITTGMTYWYQGVWEVLDAVYDAFPSVPTAVGGVYASLLPNHLRDRYPEVHISQGDVITDMSRFLMQCGLPVPEKTCIPLPPVSKELWKEAAVLRLNQGCPYDCDYCASPVLCKKFVPGDPDRAVRWLIDLYRATGIQNIAFYDDALLVNKHQVLIPFLQRVIDAGIDFRFYTPNGLHISEIDLSAARLMRQAGFQELRMGFESSSETFHEQYGRKFSKNTFSDMIDEICCAGFSASQIRVYILAGLPGQYSREVTDSLLFASQFGVSVSIAEYTPVPCTSLWEESCRRSRYPLSKEPLYHNNSLQPLAWEQFSTKDMQRIKLLAKSLNESNREK